ncbi:MAG: GNAT family N-acetyltransferase [Saccharospirillum sp.]|nr:GNAT family N-acetyltransferase [Saccharospirillum sp.]
MPLEQAFTVVDKKAHDLKAFDCGEPSMNTFLARFAQKHSQIGLSRTYVLSEQRESTDVKARVAAYFTLCASSITKEAIPAKQSLPPYRIPVVLLARLAVHAVYHGQGLGGKTLISALRQARALTESGLPAYGLVLDVLNERALSFYQRYEMFEPLTDDPMRLFVPMRTLQTL